MASNGISTLAVNGIADKPGRQTAKLNLAQTRRKAGGDTTKPYYRPLNTYNIGMLHQIIDYRNIEEGKTYTILSDFDPSNSPLNHVRPWKPWVAGVQSLAIQEYHGIQVGQTYTIFADVTVGGGAGPITDWASMGASSNDIGTVFTATGMVHQGPGAIAYVYEGSAPMLKWHEFWAGGGQSDIPGGTGHNPSGWMDSSLARTNITSGYPDNTKGYVGLTFTAAFESGFPTQDSRVTGVVMCGDDSDTPVAGRPWT
jgi:hypothetical protein